jgi:hypothetical protein
VAAAAAAFVEIVGGRKRERLPPGGLPGDATSKLEDDMGRGSFVELEPPAATGKMAAGLEARLWALHFFPHNFRVFLRGASVRLSRAEIAR